MSRGYQLPDEPAPSTLSHLVVRPHVPLLAMMFGGTWLAWPWFAFNAFALGSPTRIRETAIAFSGFLGSALVATAIVTAAGVFDLDKSMPYLWVLLTAYKIGLSYLLVRLQQPGFGVYEYYGGRVREGAFLAIIAGMYLETPFRKALEVFAPYELFVWLVLS